MLRIKVQEICEERTRQAATREAPRLENQAADGAVVPEHALRKKPLSPDQQLAVNHIANVSQ